MDVPKLDKLEVQTETQTEQKGHELIQTLVSLTGLPESLASQEMEQILEMSGHAPAARTDLTLDELRQAILTYLEALAPPLDEETPAEPTDENAGSPIRLHKIDS